MGARDRGPMADVRPATRADADDIAKVHVESWRVGYRGIVDDEVLDSEEFATNRHAWWRAWQFLPGSEVIVATDDVLRLDEILERTGLS